MPKSCETDWRIYCRKCWSFTNEKIYQFYEVWLPHDSIQIEIDWQSSVAGLFINVGGTRPTTKNDDFKLLPPGTDTIFTIAKFDN